MCSHPSVFAQSPEKVKISNCLYVIKSQLRSHWAFKHLPEKTAVPAYTPKWVKTVEGVFPMETAAKEFPNRKY